MTISVIWIAGDINLPNVDWKSNVIHGATYPIPLYSTFIHEDLIETHGFTQIVDFLSKDNNIIIFVSSITSLNPPTKRRIHLWSKADLSNIQQLASNLCTRFMHTYYHSTLSMIYGMELRVFAGNV